MKQIVYWNGIMELVEYGAEYVDNIPRIITRNFVDNTISIIQNYSIYQQYIEDLDSHTKKLAFEMNHPNLMLKYNLAYTIADLLQLPLIGTGASRAVYWLGNCVLKLDISDTDPDSNLLENLLELYIHTEGYSFVPELLKATPHISISEYIPNVGEDDFPRDEVLELGRLASSLGIYLMDIDGSAQLGRRDNGELIVLDLGECTVSDELYVFLNTLDIYSFDRLNKLDLITEEQEKILWTL